MYQACAELLSQSNRNEEAIQLLKKGINEIPVDKGLFSIYQACAELLSQADRNKEVIELLKNGINKVPVKYQVNKLFEDCVRYLLKEKNINVLIQQKNHFQYLIGFQPQFYFLDFIIFFSIKNPLA